ncbi:MAG: DUF3611 family protein [Elainellaceae cyanobacterium]
MPDRCRVLDTIRLRGCLRSRIDDFSNILLAFAIIDPNFNLKTSSPASGAGLFFASSGFLVLCFSTYWAFTYTRIAKKLSVLSESATHPKKSDVIHLLQRGLTFNAIGMILTLLGIEVIVGTLLAMSLTQVEGLAIYNSSQLIEPLDILVVQANINAIAAQLVGIIAPAWLASQISHH